MASYGGVQACDFGLRRVVCGGGQRLVVEDDVGDGARVDAELVAEVCHAGVAVLRSSGGPVTSCAKLVYEEIPKE